LFPSHDQWGQSDQGGYDPSQPGSGTASGGYEGQSYNRDLDDEIPF
jgi:hypothetical protein